MRDTVVKVRNSQWQANVEIKSMEAKGYELVDTSSNANHGFFIGSQRRIVLTFKKRSEA